LTPTDSGEAEKTQDPYLLLHHYFILYQKLLLLHEEITNQIWGDAQSVVREINSLELLTLQLSGVSQDRPGRALKLLWIWVCESAHDTTETDANKLQLCNCGRDLCPTNYDSKSIQSFANSGLKTNQNLRHRYLFVI